MFNDGLHSILVTNNLKNIILDILKRANLINQIIRLNLIIKNFLHFKINNFKIILNGSEQSKQKFNGRKKFNESSIKYYQYF